VRPVARAWKLAAAAVLISAGGWAVSNTSLVSRDVEPRAGAAIAANVPAAGVPGTAAIESDTIAPAAAVPVAAAQTEVAALSIVGGVSDLTDAQLEELIQDLDAIATVPSADPVPITLSVDDMGGM